MKCPECREADLKSSRTNFRYQECGLDNVVLENIEVRRCPKCGNELVALPRLEELHRLLAQIIITQPARLSPNEVKFLRKSLGWSGADFARHMHVEASTVSRWESVESGQMMNEQNELLLRCMVALGKRLEEYDVDVIEKVADNHAKRQARIVVCSTKNKWTSKAA
jgi:putative zinc finger/helix-turn-helix YgiT family protein